MRRCARAIARLSGKGLADLSTSENEEIYQTRQLPNSSQATIINGPIQYDVAIFIDLIKEEPCLWNTSSRAYKEQNKKRKCMVKMAHL